MKAYSNEHADEVAALNAGEESKKQSLPFLGNYHVKRQSNPRLTHRYHAKH